VLADAASSPAPSVTALILSSSVLAGILTVLGKGLDLLGSRAIARSQRLSDASGLEIQSIRVPTRKPGYGVLTTILWLLLLYFLGALVFVAVWLHRGGFDPFQVSVLVSSCVGILLTVWIALRTRQAARSAVGTYNTGHAQFRASKTNVMERCRYALNGIGAVVLSYELTSGWIRAQRGLLGQEVIATIEGEGPTCNATITSVSTFQLLPGTLDFGVNRRNVRRVVELMVGGSRNASVVKSPP